MREVSIFSRLKLFIGGIILGRKAKVRGINADNNFVNKKKDPNKAHYFKPGIIEEFTRSILLLCDQNESPSLTVWEKGEDENRAEQYTALTYLADQKVIKMKPIGNFISKISGSSMAGKTVLLKVQENNKTHYFTGGFFKFNPEDLSYTLEIKQDIVKSQQRANYRLTCSDVIVVQFKIDQQVFNSLDISVGGTSFMVDKDDLERFKKGNTFNDCTLRFDRKNYHIPLAEVAIIIPITENDHIESKYQIGISFKHIPRSMEDELSHKITNEARGEEMKIKFDTILAKKSGPT